MTCLRKQVMEFCYVKLFILSIKKSLIGKRLNLYPKMILEEMETVGKQSMVANKWEQKWSELEEMILLREIKKLFSQLHGIFVSYITNSLLGVNLKKTWLIGLIHKLVTKQLTSKISKIKPIWKMENS